MDPTDDFFFSSGDNQATLNVPGMVAGGFTPKRVHTHRVHTYIDSTSDQVLKMSNNHNHNNYKYL